MGSGDILHLPGTEPRPLDVAALERDVAALWREQGAGKVGEDVVARACHSTLVVAGSPAGDGSDVDEAELLEDIARNHPSRVIIVHEDPAWKEGDVTGWVTASCSRDAGERTWVCSESIHLRAGPGSDSRVAAAVRSLEVGGVPLVALVEPGSPGDVGWVGELARELDLILGDSSDLSPEAASSWWKILVGGGGPRQRDLHWTRTLDWRRALARGFDGPGEVRDLESVSGIRFRVRPGTGGAGFARILAGWLASRLGWTIENGKLRGPGGPIEFAVEEAPETTRGFCSGIEMVFSRPDANRRWFVAEGGACISFVRGDGIPGRLDRTRTSRAWAVVREIHEHQPDGVARDALRRAASLEVSS